MIFLFFDSRIWKKIESRTRLLYINMSYDKEYYTVEKVLEQCNGNTRLALIYIIAEASRITDEAMNHIGKNKFLFNNLMETVEFINEYTVKDLFDKLH